MAPEFEWDPGADGVEPPPSDLLEFWAVRPAIDPAAIWDEVQAGMRAGGRAGAPGPISFLRSGMSERASRWGAVAATIVVGAVVGAALLVSTSDTVSASFLEDVEQLSARTAAALDDGDLSASEAVTLEVLASELVARLEAGEDLASLPATELDTVIRTLIGVRADLTARTIDAPEASEQALASLAMVSSVVGDARTSQSGGGTLLPVVPSTAASTVIDELVPLALFPLTVLAGEGGSVEIRVVVGGLEVGAVNPAEGWSVEVQAARGRIVAVAFVSAQASSVHTSVDLRAELEGNVVAVRLVLEDTAAAEEGGSEAAVASGAVGEDGVAAAEGAVAAAEDAGGRLETTAARSAGRVAVRRPATGLAAEGGDREAVEEGAEDDLPFMLAIDGELSRSFAVAGGTITIDVTETSIALLEVVAKEGWQIVTEQIAGREARVVLEDQEGDRATFKAEVAGGRLTIKSALVKHGDGDEDDDDGDDD